MRSPAVYLFFVFLALIAPNHLWVAQPLPAPAPTTAPANAMPVDALNRLDQNELGSLYRPDQAASYLELHTWLEAYFKSPPPLSRKEITQRIAAYGIDANIVGRLVQILMDWPQLNPGPHLIDAQVGPQHLQYYLGIPPKYDRTTRWPLVIKLPPFAPFFTNPKPDATQIARLYTGWINDELTAHPDALVLMPMLDTAEGFGPSYAGMNSVIGSMNHAMSQVNIDPARVYLIAQDGAAGAVWNIGLLYPTYFAAINPFAGSVPADWQRLRFENLSNISVIAWNDTENKTDPIAGTRQIVQILKRFKCDASLIETQHLSTSPSPPVVQQAYETLRSKVRKLYPANVRIASNRPDTIFNRADWVQMYQATRPGHEQHILFHHAGYMLVDANPMSIQASIANNTITATTDNVESMRFYLNDQMFDFSKPLVLNINGHEKFRRIVKPNIDEMLKDQLFLGRGWRYYTVVIDLDFGQPATKPAPAH